ncbi:hypothetical protein [Streptomyces acidiscabies]|uniref:Cysteinyl-tRNA synthetase n=1 Tax=Streptomyces acidiscabies TaxID=42234 RepID=A0AAP6EIP2_9ACTN|nr:hypothetical protein [Streptomyces acidiscabies]MBP5941037.1 hypothetical protein [Streptomyces sp. LBUM 1476]MBZ3912353.1 hypothetical protein [Streptomyces acidiscabies]MDX2964129.1 hypothetical protein [Streptomyces acidiscabies]MDX3021686.1 hypothetical protein [Streptomyces acidiscabies]MDX3795059.1 hypothetical protein [Streptomyces acidiscabies]
MLRIIDARTGQPVAAAPVRRGLTRVEVHASGYGTGSLRVLLVADLLVRALELGGTPVWTLLTGERDQAELRAGAVALGTRPFEDSRDVGAGLGEAQVVHVAREDGARPDGLVLTVAPVEGVTSPSAAWDTDPAVLRLALLAARRGTALRLDEDAVREARETLARWRHAVADWARRPSRPVPDAVRARLRHAWEDDLDVPAVLGVLRDVETDPALPDGARFETYAYADRLLGLDLARDLGSLA